MYDTRSFESRILENNFANKKCLCDFLVQINNDFPVELSEKVNFNEYADKIFDLGIILEVSMNENILGILTFYANDLIGREGCYSILGVLKKYRRLGIASKLCQSSFEIMKNNGMKTAYTSTHKDNQKAITFYQNLGFAIDTNRPNWYEYNVSLIKKLEI